MGSYKCQSARLLLVLFLFLCPGESGYCLEPSEVVVVANRAISQSLRLALYYMKQRDIPLANLISVKTGTTELCTRQEYEEQIRQPILRQLDSLRAEKRIRCLVTMYGMPLKIADDQENLSGLQHTRAAVDSELSLVLAGSYDLAGWQRNPYFLGFQGQDKGFDKDVVLMVSRLDGPDPDTVRRMIDDSLEAERKGLHGMACLDGRWPLSRDGSGRDGYALYDRSIHRTATLPVIRRRMSVRQDSRPELLQPGACPGTALYCGWYSPDRYIEAFTWVRGAVGYHIASNTCLSLRTDANRYWCVALLKSGVAATVGAVYEPYVQGFPLPELFFGHLAEGYLSLAECYLISVPYFSWQVILLGDPLYMPFSPLEGKNLLEREPEGT